MARDFTPSEREDLREPSSAIPSDLDHEVPKPHREAEARSDVQHSTRAKSSHQNRGSRAQLPDSRTVMHSRDRAYRMRDSEIRTLAELGRFRIIGTEDLNRHAYGGSREELENDLRNLVRQGLVERKKFEGPDASSRELLSLTKAGHTFLSKNHVLPEGQSSYYGFVKPKEANHDADIYRLYQKEIAKIIDQGGKNPRVVLDFELKRKLNRDFARFGSESRGEIAARHGLQVVRGKVPVPDLRIEYETRDGEPARVDVELATEHYRPRQLADKVRAGFSIYTSLSEHDHLRRIVDGQQLVAEILTL